MHKCVRAKESSWLKKKNDNHQFRTSLINIECRAIYLKRKYTHSPFVFRSVGIDVFEIGLSFCRMMICWKSKWWLHSSEINRWPQSALPLDVRMIFGELTFMPISGMATHVTIFPFFFRSTNQSIRIASLSIANEQRANQAQITWDIFMSLLLNFIRRSTMTHLILLNTTCHVRSKHAITYFLSFAFSHFKIDIPCSSALRRYILFRNRLWSGCVVLKFCRFAFILIDGASDSYELNGCGVCQSFCALFPKVCHRWLRM